MIDPATMTFAMQREPRNEYDDRNLKGLPQPEIGATLTA